MDILKSTFAAALEVVDASLSACDFVAIDTEFTGLSSTGARRGTSETLADRFATTRKDVQAFAVIQFGLAAFKWIEATQGYECEAFNFYVFPSSFQRTDFDPRFLCQSSSISFLSGQGFDFNKLFRDGIPYARLSNERSKKGATAAAAEPIVMTDPDALFIADMLTAIETWLQTTPGTERQLHLAPCNAFRRRLLYQEVPLRFPNGVGLESSKGDSEPHKHIIVNRLSVEEKAARAEKKFAQLRQQTEAAAADRPVEAVGFQQIIARLQSCGRPVIAHNALLDLMFTVEQFVQPLPELLVDAKKVLAGVFPSFIDTKLLCAVDIVAPFFPLTSLETLHTATNASPFSCVRVTCAASCDKYAAACGDAHDSAAENGGVGGGLHLHEAGYDALMTGMVFLRLAHALSAPDEFAAAKQSGTRPAPVRIDFSHAALAPYKQKVAVQGLPLSPFLDLITDEPVIAATHIFAISNFPAEWKTIDVMNLFNGLGKVFVKWINGTLCYGIMQDPSKSSDAVQRFKDPAACQGATIVQVPDMTTPVAAVAAGTPVEVCEAGSVAETGDGEPVAETGDGEPVAKRAKKSKAAKRSGGEGNKAANEQ